MKWTVPVICMALLYSSCSAGKTANNKMNNRDSSLLFRKDSLIIAGTVPTSIKIEWPAAVNKTDQNKILLFLDRPQIIAAPDGVYEIYLTAEYPAIQTLSAGNPGFLTVMDTYPLTGPDAKDYLQLDISTAIKKLSAANPSQAHYFIMLLFRGSKLPDGTESRQSGEIRFGGLRVVGLRG